MDEDQIRELVRKEVKGLVDGLETSVRKSIADDLPNFTADLELEAWATRELAVRALALSLTLADRITTSDDFRRDVRDCMDAIRRNDGTILSNAFGVRE